jgi:hypothetical protein
MVKPSKSASHPKVKPERLMYSVKLGFVFVFHEDELKLRENENGVKDTLAKELPYVSREVYNFTCVSLRDLPDHIYNSWGLRKTRLTSSRTYLTPYHTEPLEIAVKELSKKCSHITFVVKTALGEEETEDIYDDDSWLVTANDSVCGVGSQNIPSWLPGVGEEDAEDWDSFGIEIESRLLRSDSTRDKKEIARVLEAIEGGDGDSYGAFITNQ